MEEEKKKFSFKDFWKDFIVPAVKEWLPDILKFFFKHWGVITLATTTAISTGGFIYEKTIYDTLRTSVDTAYISAQSELDRLKSELNQLKNDLESTRASLAESLGSVERQREIIRDLQETNRRLREIYTGLGNTTDQLRAGELGIRELIEESLRINRLSQSQIDQLAGNSK